MAGGYRHCRKRKGQFWFDLIDNMGDAHEACEMMFWMIGYLSDGDEKRIKGAETAYYESRRAGKERRG